MGVDRPVDPVEPGLAGSMERHRAYHRHQGQQPERDPRLTAPAEEPLDREEEQRDDQVELLLGGERPAAAHLTLGVVGEEDQVWPEAVPLPKREGDERHPGEVQRPDAQSPAEQEAGDLHRPGPLQLALELPADEEAGEDEEEVHPGPSIAKEDQAPARRGHELRAADRQVVADDEDDRRGSKRIERGKRPGWGHEQRPECPPRPLPGSWTLPGALAHAHARSW